ncbi:MAG: M15 family metallopeptidase [Clostridia bacterium]|nr:M15 family metallopeptidase [Clostridia bacterium]
MLSKLLALMLMLLSLSQSAVDSYVNEMNLGGYLFLVNRTYSVSSDYEPADLTVPRVKGGGENTMLRWEAAQALEKMFQAAQEEKGYQLVAISGYRSYGKQFLIHQRKVQNVGKKAALRVSAPAGCSEHQLGLAMDLGCKGSMGLTERFAKTPEGKWVSENCHRFGFIIRYKAEWEEITGYAYEPWHIRYVGVEHATRIHQLDIPFEYYIAQLRQAQYALVKEKYAGKE